MASPFRPFNLSSSDGPAPSTPAPRTGSKRPPTSPVDPVRPAPSVPGQPGANRARVGGGSESPVPERSQSRSVTPGQQSIAARSGAIQGPGTGAGAQTQVPMSNNTIPPTLGQPPRIPRFVQEKFERLESSLDTLRDNVPENLTFKFTAVLNDMRGFKTDLDKLTEFMNTTFKTQDERLSLLESQFKSHLDECTSQEVTSTESKTSAALSACIRTVLVNLMGISASDLLPDPLPDGSFWVDAAKKEGLRPGWSLGWKVNSEPQTGWVTAVVELVKAQGTTHYSQITQKELDATHADVVKDAMHVSYNSYVERYNGQGKPEQEKEAEKLRNRIGGRKKIKADRRAAVIDRPDIEKELLEKTGSACKHLREAGNQSSDHTVYETDPNQATDGEGAILSDDDNSVPPAPEPSAPSVPKGKRKTNRLESCIPDYRADCVEVAIQIVERELAPMPNRTRTGRIVAKSALPELRASKTRPNPEKMGLLHVKESWLEANNPKKYRSPKYINMGLAVGPASAAAVGAGGIATSVRSQPNEDFPEQTEGYDGDNDNEFWRAGSAEGTINDEIDQLEYDG
ncbi:unnamed protein product [Peniophora sp. CBMAI 1063]|nr:unnamed protein product [Peniophora sp. CBMAI 1063]